MYIQKKSFGYCVMYALYITWIIVRTTLIKYRIPSALQLLYYWLNHQHGSGSQHSQQHHRRFYHCTVVLLSWYQYQIVCSYSLHTFRSEHFYPWYFVCYISFCTVRSYTYIGFFHLLNRVKTGLFALSFFFFFCLFCFLLTTKRSESSDDMYSLRKEHDLYLQVERCPKIKSFISQFL